MSNRLKYGDDHNNEILRLYVEEELSLSKIAQKFSMHPEVIKRKLKSMGVIAIRGKKEAMMVFHRQRQIILSMPQETDENDFPVIKATFEEC